MKGKFYGWHAFALICTCTCNGANRWLLFILAGTHGLHMQTLSLPAAAEHLLPHGSLL